MSDAQQDQTAVGLLDRLRSLRPRLANEAPKAEKLRRPTDTTIRALEESGVFGLLVPKSHGGLGLDLETFVEAGLILGEADLSIGWISTFYIEHNWILCQFPASLQHKLFANQNYVLAPGAISPGGRAQSVEGGYRISGRWPWGTGVMHASWALVGALVEGEEGPDALRFFAITMDQVQIEDTWFVDGMVGTGSNDMRIDDVFVGQEQSVVMSDLAEGRAPGAALHDTALYATPMAPILTLAATLPIVGQTRACLDGFTERLGEQRRFFARTAAAATPAAQMRLARARLEFRQVELLLEDTVQDVIARRNEAHLVDRARWAASLAHIAHQCRSILHSISEASGASAHYRENPLQRAVRDVNTATGHVVFSLDAQRELFGRLLLGLEPGPGLY